jgi:predicted nucleic acid-binding protein
MPEVIADTSPLQYLHQISRLDFLRRLYQRVSVPRAVADELRRGADLGIRVPDLDRLPWVTIEASVPRTVQALSEGLGPGERAVIALALEHPGSLVILDDGEARQRAKTLGIRCTGTIGVLAKAKDAGWVPALRPMLDQLVQTGFFLDVGTRVKILKLLGETP